MRSGQTQRARLLPLALLVTVTTSIALHSDSVSQDNLSRIDGFAVRDETLEGGGLPPVTLRFLFGPGSDQPDRIVDITRRAMVMLGSWFERYPRTHLTIVDAPWRSRDDLQLDDGSVIVSSRWLTPARDMGLERSLIVSVARTYVDASGEPGTPGPAAQALVRYTAARAINELLQGHDVPTFRFFGEFVPYAVRSVSLSRPRRDSRPPFRAYEELGDAPDPVLREAEGLHTLERVIGWPAMRAALAEYVNQRLEGASSASAFIDVVNRQRGTPIAWWPADNFRSAAVDYRLTALTTTGRPDDASFETHVQVTADTFGGATLPPVAVTTVFADGTEMREQTAGNTRQVDFNYVSSRPAVSAVVDPDAVLLVDSNRLNNIRSLTIPTSSVAWRFALSWVTWLQHMTMTYIAFV